MTEKVASEAQWKDLAARVKDAKNNATVGDKQITTAKIADKAVTSDKIDWTTVEHRIIAKGTITATNVARKTAQSGTINGNFGNDYMVFAQHKDAYSGEWTLQYFMVHSHTKDSFSYEIFNDGTETHTSHWDYVVIS